MRTNGPHSVHKRSGKVHGEFCGNDDYHWLILIGSSYRVKDPIAEYEVASFVYIAKIEVDNAVAIQKESRFRHDYFAGAVVL